MGYSHNVSKENDESMTVPEGAYRRQSDLHCAHNRLCDDAAWGPVVSIGINGSWMDRLRVGGVRCHGEEDSEGVHCCLGVG